ncbi:MAG: TrmH family RNA methyltransferase [Pseudomonadota bacterium]
MPRLCLFQPDIAGNVGSMLRLSACLAIPCEVIGPCGFPWDDHRLRRAGMDYIHQADYRFHNDWAQFLSWRDTETPEARLILLTTRGNQPLPTFQWAADDLIMVGQESAGAPQKVHDAAHARLRVPAAARALNVATTAALALGHAINQLDAWPAND